MKTVQTICGVVALATFALILVGLIVAAWCWIAEDYFNKRADEGLRAHLEPIADVAPKSSEWRSWARSAQTIHELPESRAEAWL
jgi:hypothetical protein